MLIEKWLVIMFIPGGDRESGREEVFAVKDTEQQAKDALLIFPKDFPRFHVLYLRQVWVAHMWVDRLRPTMG